MYPYKKINDEWEKQMKETELNMSMFWMYLCANPSITYVTVKSDGSLTFFTVDEKKEMFFRKKLREWFKKSDLKRELIAKLWHPKKYKKYKYYDPEMFSDGEEEQ